MWKAWQQINPVIKAALQHGLGRQSLTLLSLDQAQLCQVTQNYCSSAHVCKWSLCSENIDLHVTKKIQQVDEFANQYTMKLDCVSDFTLLKQILIAPRKWNWK